MTSERKWIGAFAIVSAIGAAVVLPTEAFAQSAPKEISQAQHNFNIKPQPLADALTEFGRQSGIQVSANGNIVRNLKTDGLRGTMSTEEALINLLEGTGLVYDVSSSGAVISAPGQSSADGSTLLAPITVESGAHDDKHVSGADRVSSVYVTSEDLERRNPRTIKQVFSGEASVSVGGGIPLSQKVYVQGVEERNLAVSIDGARQNNRVFHHSNNNLIDPSLLKAVRIDPGVAPADAGPAAMGGAIVYETVDVGDLLKPGRSVGGFTSNSYDTDSVTIQTSNAAYARAEGFEILGFAKLGKGDDYTDGDGQTVNGTGTDMLSLLGKVGYEGFGHRFELSAENIKDDSNRPYRANLSGLTTSTFADERAYEMTRQNYTFNYDMTKAQGFIDPKVTVGYGMTELSIPVADGSVGQTGSLSAKVENDFNLSETDIITTGVDFYNDFANYVDDTTITTRVKETAQNVGLFVQARIEPVERLRLSFGMRGDQQWYEGYDGTEENNSGLSYNATTAMDLSDEVTLSLGYSNVWGGMALSENFLINRGWSYDTDLMKPVRAENFNIGVGVEHAGYSFDTRVFHSDFTNARRGHYTRGPDNLTGDFTAKGFEIGAGYAWQNGFAKLSYSDTELKVNNSAASSYDTQDFGAPLGRVIAFETAYSFDKTGLMLGGTIEAALKENSTADAGNGALEAYETLGVYAEYVPPQTDFLTLRVEVNNITDEKYADRASYGQDFATVEPMYEPGRSFLLKAKAEF